MVYSIIAHRARIYVDFFEVAWLWYPPFLLERGYPLFYSDDKQGALCSNGHRQEPTAAPIPHVRNGTLCGHAAPDPHMGNRIAADLPVQHLNTQ